jgi:uncharacterized delta-60 repeat protein
MITTSDGKIVVVGSLTTLLDGDPGKFLVARFNADGSPDETFGTQGWVSPFLGEANSVVVQPDGKLLVTGDLDFMNPINTQVHNLIPLVRYNADGSLDSTFGTDGVVYGPVGSDGNTVLLQPDGKIVVVAHGVAQNSVELVRYNADGTLDTTFGTGGIATSLVGESAIGNSGALLLPNGQILVGVTPPSSTATPAEIVRFNSDGSLDQSFGTNGIAVVPDHALGTAAGIALQSDGKILLSAFSDHGDLLARFDANGSLDTSFGSSGQVITPVAGTLAIQPAGEIAIFGGYTGANQSAAVLISYLPNGTVDTGFGAGGSANLNPALTTSFPAYFGDQAMTIDANGKIIVSATGPATGADTRLIMEGYASNMPSAANLNFVTNLYQALLGRSPDQAGLYSWANLLDQKAATSSQVVDDFQQTTEHRSQIVDSLYQKILNRTADPAGEAFWVSYLGGSGTTEGVELSLLSSPEYFQLHGGTDTGLIAGFYQDLLGRTADSAGSQAWMLALQNGESSSAVAQAILRSAEGAHFEVDALYESLLKRQADSAGLEFYSNALLGGATYEQIVADLASSEEFQAMS